MQQKIVSPSIVIVGSMNLDHTFSTPRIPQPGETVQATRVTTSRGGKGGNAAIAARRAGGRVAIIGCLGDDDAGRHYRTHLQREGINTDGVVISQHIPTGAAFITVDDVGENTIVVHSGANACVGLSDIDASATAIATADLLLMQFEIPLEVVAQSADIARKSNVVVIINPSPWNDLFRESKIHVDIIIVNETEAMNLTQQSIEWLRENPLSVCDLFCCSAIVVTRGNRSTLIFQRGQMLQEVMPPTVVPRDTVGAGDAFAGAFAVKVAEGDSLLEAVAFANTAGALSTLVCGAQSAIPTRHEILARLMSKEIGTKE